MSKLFSFVLLILKDYVSPLRVLREYYLRLKVICIHLLIKARILKNVWYKSELELGKIKGKKLYEVFNKGTHGEESREGVNPISNKKGL